MRTIWLLGLLSGLVLVGSLAIARPPYRTQAIAQFHLVPDQGSTRVIGCQYCHVGASGGAPWNAFGNLVRANFREGIQMALYQALKAGQDSDGDGYTDALEVFAGTLPGDANSRPLVEAAYLKTNFEKAGGVDLYKP